MTVSLRGPFNNHATLKLPFLRYHPFIIDFSFLKLKKKQRYTPTHDTCTHGFKQLDQIVWFK